MSGDEARTRDYRDSDYPVCEALVNQAWEFDRHFAPPRFADLLKYLYTMGSVAAANFHRVMEVDGNVVGFIFGLNEHYPIPKHKLHSLPVRIGLLLKILFIRGMSLKRKFSTLNAFDTHDANRKKVIGQNKNEIVLFVVDSRFQGQGIGKRLLSEFLQYCRESGVQSVIVESNHSGAATFYQGAGFKHKGDFDSPLHGFVTPEGQACVYEYIF